jgi:Zn-dependent protease with chaperone function
VTYSVTLCLVLAAVYGLFSVLLSVLVAVAWHVTIERTQPSANELLALRLLPAGGATLLALTVVLPAFLVSEPTHELEKGGPLLLALTLFALLTVGGGLRRAWSASMAARALLIGWSPTVDRSVIAGHPVNVVDVPEPIVAVVGGWRPRVIASRRVLSVCNSEELSQVIAHELAHVSARDNLKLLLLILGPDLLAWLPTGAALEVRWRATAEREADERAAGPDRRKRVALASALIKVARLSTIAAPPLSALSMPIAADDVEGRVRVLLAPSRPAHRMGRIWGLAVSCLLVPAISVPLYGLIHQFIEILVAFGR